MRWVQAATGRVVAAFFWRNPCNRTLWGLASAFGVVAAPRRWAIWERSAYTSVWKAPVQAPWSRSTWLISEGQTMVEPDNLRLYEVSPQQRIGRDSRPWLWHADSRPDGDQSRDQGALEAGFRQLDASERYRNEPEVGEARAGGASRAGKIKGEEVFITTKLWNHNHRPERVQPAFETSLKRLQLRLPRSLPHPYSLRLPARRRAGPEGHQRQRDLRQGGDTAGHVAGRWRA